MLKPGDIAMVSGARTPFGRYCGKLKDFTAQELGAIAGKCAIERAGLDPGQFDHAVFGNAQQTSGDALYGARHVALRAGLPIETPALTVNRLCGSGMQAIVNAAQMIQLGEANVVLAGGMEAMSQAPFVIRGREGFTLAPGGKLEGLAKLKPAFGKNGTVTAGNASGIVDGGAAVVVTSLDEVGKRGIKPLGRIVSWGIAGVEPKIMGRGPVPATKIALQKAGLTLDYIDLIEVNEAFAAQYLAVEKELGLDRDKVNVNGGAIALGHPLGATGARLVITLLYALRRRKKKYGLATACIGGGQGIAMIVESLN